MSLDDSGIKERASESMKYADYYCPICGKGFMTHEWKVPFVYYCTQCKNKHYIKRVAIGGPTVEPDKENLNPKEASTSHSA